MYQGHDAPLKAPHDLYVVGRDEDRRAEGCDVGEKFHHLPGRVDVEVAGRLVGDQKGRLPDDRACDCHPLLLAARKLVRKGVAAVAETDGLQSVEGAFPGLAVRDTQVADLEREGDVFHGRQPREELVVLEDDPDAPAELRDAGCLHVVRGEAVHPDPTHGGPDLAVDQPEQGGLAGSAGPDQEREFSRLQCQADVIERKASSVRSSHPGELEDRAQYTMDNGECARSLSTIMVAGRSPSP